MKRFISLCLTVMLVLTLLCSCKTENNAEVVSEPEITPEQSLPTEEPTVEPTQALALDAITILKYRVNADGTEFYSEANTDKLLGTKKFNEIVDVVEGGQEGEFAKIHLEDGSYAYIKAKFLTVDTGADLIEAEATATANNGESTGTTTGDKEDSDEEKIVSDSPYYLYYEKGSFTLTVYGKDDNGDYTRVVRTIRAAHGGNKTPAGTFKLGGKERWHTFPNGGSAQYAVKYHNKLYIHSSLYETEDPQTMWPKYYNGEKGIGKASTGGCLRMTVAAAKFIYNNCPSGTILKIVNGSPKGTSSSGIPDYVVRNIDPTDTETMKAAGLMDEKGNIIRPGESSTTDPKPDTNPDITDPPETTDEHTETTDPPEEGSSGSTEEQEETPPNT